MKFLSFFIVLLFSFSSSAKVFSNSYISFNLPPNWNCDLESTVWSCNSQLSKNTKEALIILTAKQTGPNDNLNAYFDHLKKQRAIKIRGGKTVSSKPVHVKKRQFNDHSWVDSLHLASEARDYYTRYLATVKKNIGIVVTFSAHKDHYTKYSTDFLSSIQSLKVTVTGNTLGSSGGSGIGAGGIAGPGGLAGPPIPTMPNFGDAGGDTAPDESQSSVTVTQIALLIFILLLIGIVLFIMKKKKAAINKKKR